MRSSIIALIPVLLASYVSAHGYLAAMKVGDQPTNRAGPPNGERNADSDTSAIRQVSSFEPVYGVDSPANNCGVQARNAPRVIDANPGDTINFDRKGADGRSNWPHNTGPMLTYLADCGDAPCSEFDSTTARWFKIHQVGLKPDSGEWFQQDLMNGGTAPVTLPSNIAPGNYLVRHEAIALHNASQPATTSSGAEFYPGCAQLRIGGRGTGRPTENELVSHPGAYQADHPGIFVPNVFGSRDYVFPGPPVAAFVDGQSNDGRASSPRSGCIILILSLIRTIKPCWKKNEEYKALNSNWT
ncbi:glycosyl hydrolase family 61-domain-containing protein [Coprinopsis sp. MPI-PUGE-AT-0042]|nr:glycosyl hydrolase family 61-domain-containing protein [Coprinopsis sp. MPI-PUGE-AT-0042]